MIKPKRQNGDSGAAVATEAPTESTVKRRPAPKQVIDAETHQWRDESKMERFDRLAEARIDKAVKYIDALSKLSNTAQYSYVNDDVVRIIAYLKQAIARVESAFDGRKTVKTGFKLR